MGLVDWTVFVNLSLRQTFWWFKYIKCHFMLVEFHVFFDFLAVEGALILFIWKSRGGALIRENTVTCYGKWLFLFGLQGELIVYQWSVNIVHTFKLEYLWSQIKFLDQILFIASLGWGKGCIRFWDRLDQNSGFHGDRKTPLTYNGKTMSPPFLGCF